MLLFMPYLGACFWKDGVASTLFSQNHDGKDVKFPQRFRAARVQNEFAPEKFLNRYEKRFEKREKGSEKRSETRLKKF